MQQLKGALTGVQRSGTDRSAKDRSATDQPATGKPADDRPAGDRPPAVFFRPPRPSHHSAAARLLPSVLFWLGLAAALAPWWSDTGPETLGDTAAMLTAAGRITGLIGGYVLLIQILLTSRLGWLERWLGARRLLLWHRELGGFVVIAVLAHLALITVGYARTDQLSLVEETKTLWNSYEDMVSAFVATGLLVSIGLLAIRGLRRLLSYELWYALHLTSYAVVVLSYGHAFANGEQLAGSEIGKWIWVGLYLVVLAAVLWGRILDPLVLNLRHRLHVVKVMPEGPDTISVYVTGQRLDRLDVKAGQFFRWRFLTPGRWWQTHPFSLSAAPHERWLRLTIKTIGDYTEGLRNLEAGTKVLVSGPFGDFTAERRTRAKALLIAAGSGIAPIRALLEELPPGAVVLYRASRPAELTFRTELEWLSQAREASVWYVIGGRDDPGPKRMFTPRGMHELVPDVARRDVYLCGPPGFVTSAEKFLRRRLRLAPQQIHLDPFEF